MKLYDMITLLKEKGIKIAEVKGEIFHDERNTENMPPYDHYGIVCENDKWYYAFSKVERVLTPEIEKIIDFDSKDEAVKYLFLKCLKGYFTQKIILPKYVWPTNIWSMKVVEGLLRVNNIPETYFSYGEKICKNSMHYYYKEDLLFFEYIGKSGMPIARSMRGFGENKGNDIWSSSIIYSLLLYFLDKYEIYIKEKGVSTDFSDIDRVNYLGMTAL